MANKKESFLEQLVSFLGSASRDVFTIFSRESFSYKDLRLGGFDPERIYHGVNNLHRRGAVRRVSRGRYAITKEGKRLIYQTAHTYFLQQHGTWDGKWRVVVFDIPQEFHDQRTTLRRKLRSLGFQPLQKSIYVFPYPCEEELGAICNNLGVGDYVDVLVAETIGSREEELKSCYKI